MNDTGYEVIQGIRRYSVGDDRPTGYEAIQCGR